MQLCINDKIKNILFITNVPTSKSDRIVTERQKPIKKTFQECKQKYKASKKVT